ncbi:hypothetical protein MYSTI_05976 [Myxococcus stipitatus DSM 14675]|uniref:Uncharacterized protein n=1 Tax=Myxococcus stipitatus (strain DSM 14675 / JCM 12634 / Mx s8) TaxID=1278073 RepID=L7ULB6_MYXSD|nr:hypothetical protein [Myxococcus stipitatus]AGC47249.1 hypothetical protein MYSTI_05976 [Myxococcus stipitatus DSM 14675]
MRDEILFYGCWRDAEHELWTPGRLRFGGQAALLPADLRPPRLDGRFPPSDRTEQEGRACLHHLDGWTVVAWWDRGVDKRRGSNSALLMRGTHPLSAVLEAAGANFPELLPRFASLVGAAAEATAVSR